VLVRTIIDMGHSLGMEVVAEGVESVRQLEFLCNSRCNMAQGQLFGEARSIDELLQLLLTQQGGCAAFANLLPVAPVTLRPVSA
jgi:EAL domain-containing protein (putative c-di-GMP-specific phosphodiesterase class I)